MNIFSNKRASGGRTLRAIITGAFTASMTFTIGHHLAALDKAYAVQTTAAPVTVAQADTQDMPAAVTPRYASPASAAQDRIFPFKHMHTRHPSRPC